MGNLRTSLDRVEWNSKLHRVTNLEARPIINFYDNTAQRPEGERDINREGARYSMASFTTQVAGNGTAGAAPFDDMLIRACAFALATNAGVSNTYTLAPAYVHDALNLSVYKGNALLIPVSNACGRVEYVIEPNAPMLANWYFTGSFTEPTSASGAAALGTTATPVVCKGLTITVDTETVKLKQMRIVIDNKFEEPDEDACGTNGIINPSIYDRSITISARFRAHIPSTVNWISKLTSEEKISFSAVLGAVAGNILTITADGYAKESLGYSEDAGRHEFELITEMGRAAGDTQLSLVYT